MKGEFPMNKIDTLFRNATKPVLSIYLTAGYPKLDSLMTLLPVLEKSGVDMVEIGMPFSDPLADGPIIQESSQIALGNGMNLTILFEQLSEISLNIPIVLMGYINPILQFGIRSFLKRCKECGVSGTILPDLPVKEYLKYKSDFEENGVHNILLVTPQTSPERVKYLAQISRGFLYVVSSASTTGTRSFADADPSYFARLKDMNIQIPRMIGFGIQTRKDFERAGHFGQGAIIGSRFIQLISEKTMNNDEGIDSLITTFVQNLR